jgi:hypothetical protein
MDMGEISDRQTQKCVKRFRITDERIGIEQDEGPIPWRPVRDGPEYRDFTMEKQRRITLNQTGAVEFSQKMSDERHAGDETAPDGKFQ